MSKKVFSIVTATGQENTTQNITNNNPPPSSPHGGKVETTTVLGGYVYKYEKVTLPPKKEKDDGGWCTILTVNEIEYDNPILNYPELLQQLASKFGRSIISKTIDFGEQFTQNQEDRALLNEVCSSSDNFRQIVQLIGLEQQSLIDEVSNY